VHQDAVPARPPCVREVEHVQVLGRQARGADAALHHDHVSDGGGGVRGARRRRLAGGLHARPRARAHVEDVDVVGGAGEADACEWWCD